MKGEMKRYIGVEAPKREAVVPEIHDIQSCAHCIQIFCPGLKEIREEKKERLEAQSREFAEKEARRKGKSKASSIRIKPQGRVRL